MAKKNRPRVMSGQLLQRLTKWSNKGQKFLSSELVARLGMTRQSLHLQGKHNPEIRKLAKALIYRKRDRLIARARELRNLSEVVSHQDMRKRLGIPLNRYSDYRRIHTEFADAVAGLRDTVEVRIERRISRTIREAKESVASGRARRLLDFIIITDLPTNTLLGHLKKSSELENVYADLPLCRRWRTKYGRKTVMCFVTLKYSTKQTREEYKRYYAQNLAKGIEEPRATHLAVDHAVGNEMKRRKAKRITKYGPNEYPPELWARRNRPLATKKAIKAKAKELFKALRVTNLERALAIRTR